MTTEIIDNASRVVRRKDVMTTDLDGEIGMIDIESGKYYALDPIGSSIWGLIEEPVPVGRIVESLLEEYDVDEATCLGHTIELLTSLRDKNLITVLPRE